MPGGQRERPGLPPSGDPAVDQARIARQARLGAQSQALGHPWPTSFDERIGGVDEGQHLFDARGCLQVDRQALAIAQHQVVLRRPAHAELDGFGPLDAKDGRAEIGKQHRRHRAGPDTGKFDDFHAMQGDRKSVV